MDKKLDLEGVLSLIAELICKIVYIEGCSIELKEKEEKGLILAVRHGRSKFCKTSLSIPIVTDAKLIGAIGIYMSKSRIFTEEEIRFMVRLATQVASCVQEVEWSKDLSENYFNTVHTLVTAIEGKDRFIKGHSRRVTNYAIRIAQRLRVSEKRINTLYYSGELHDIGKVKIKDVILNKPGKLTKAEYKIIKLHPVKGVQMLKPLKFLKEGLPIVRYHHERFDGDGYPDKLVGKKIPLEARILTCTDAFDAMISERSYKKKLTLQEAIEELRRNSGTQFDPEIVQALLEILPKNESA